MTRSWVCGAVGVSMACTASVAPIAPPPPAGGLAAPTPAVSVIAPAPVPVPASASGPAPTASASALPLVPQGHIGSAGPVTLLATAASGAWVALCSGSPATATLVLGSGNGEPIDAVLAHDASGRHVIVQQGTAAHLIDVATSQRVDLAALGADVRRAKQDYATHRAFSFDASSRHLAYLRGRGAQTRIVVRELLTGSERSFDPGVGEVFRVQLSTDARYVAFETIRADTSKNGRLDWPTPAEPSPPQSCGKPSTPKLRSYAYLGRGDALTRAVVSVADGHVRDLPELLTPLGSRLLVRESDGSLRLDLAGKRSPFAPAACAGRLLFADADREQALVTCAAPKKPGKRDVWLFASGYSKNLQSELYETSTDREAVSGVRLVPVYPGSETSLVDLERRDVLPLPTGSRVIHAQGALALIWRGHELFSYDAQAKREERLASGVLKNPDLLRAGSAVLLSPFVVVGAAGPVLESPTRLPLAVTTFGHVLAATPSREPPAASPTGPAIQGPLHWLDARLPPPDGPPR